MFKLYKTWLIKLLRRPMNIFWILLFPMLLATLFYMTMSSATIYNEFENKVKVEVINADNEMYDTLTEIFKEDQLAKFYEFTYSDNLDNSNEKLENKEIDGVLKIEKDSEDSYKLNITYGKSSFNNSMVESLLTNIENSVNINYSIAVNNMGQVKPVEEKNIAENSMENSNVKDSSMATIYVYPLIIFAILHTGLLLAICIRDINASMSHTGSRIEMGKVSKMKLLISAIAAIYTIGIGLIAILVIYVEYILKMNTGVTKHIFELFVNTSAGIITSLCLSAFISYLFSRKGLEMIETVDNAVLMLLYFLAGGMIGNLSVIIKNCAPIAYYGNFATLISDNFKFINYKTDFSIFWNNIGITLGIGGVLFILTLIVQRRKKNELY